MTNPDNIVRVRARNGGRASVFEANGWGQAYTAGIIDGNGVVQNTSADMNVLVGGSAAKPDVLLAENPSGYRIALDVVGQQAVAITAPAQNSRITAIVAYTDDLSLSTTQDTVTGSPASCGLIAVNGTAAADPSEPTDAQIRTAITSDGATGSQAAYCIIATILVANDTTAITNSLITNNVANVRINNLNFTNTTTTQTITWKNEGGTTVGTTSCTMVKLDDSGLTLCTMRGAAWANNSSPAGYVNIKSGWQTAPKSIVGGVVDCSMSSDTGSYKTYGDINITGFDIWINKTASGTRNLNVQAIFLAYF